MAKTSTLETPKRKSYDKGQENVAAALDALDGVSVTVAKSVSIIKRRLEELDDLVVDMETKLRDQEMENAKTTQELRTRLDIAEEKLRKVQATLG